MKKIIAKIHDEQKIKFLNKQKKRMFITELSIAIGFPDGSDGKESACSAGDPGLIQVGKIPWKGMSTHFSILAWRIPWTERPGRPQSTGLQRVRLD